MKFLIFVSCVALCYAASLTRTKREAYNFPDGAELIVGSIKTSFQCSTGGYFADQDNDCKVFHICQINELPDGKTEIVQDSFFCPNQTVFSQFSMTCATAEEAIPCASSAEFFYLNERIGKETAKLHEDADVAKADALIPSRRQ